MNSKPRGHVLIINNEEYAENAEDSIKHLGHNNDSKNLDDLFSQLGFQVHMISETQFLKILLLIRVGQKHLFGARVGSKFSPCPLFFGSSL